ncbi:hypothetical protein DUI87_16345 [Hirundo rustica rustica]|uniref:Endonuclease/exonuclease/phosphatase domain-containing protein n=1 Tax=Hirundo rustica rustica TaxID=333673 RepID=A0A3M0K108_HIRRU|nr:hypothetical protein DUI87_16345 [Hirundo rustica rustica]
MNRKYCTIQDSVKKINPPSAKTSAKIEQTPRSPTVIWMRDYNHTGVCWESNTASCKQSWRLLGCAENNFLVQVLDKSTSIEILLDLVLTNAEVLIQEDKIGYCLGCSDHALIELVISRNTGLAKSQISTMNFRKVNFQLFKEIVDYVQMSSEYLPG